MSEANKAIVRRWIEDAMNRRNLNLLEELADANFLRHDAASPNLGRGPKGEQQLMTMYISAFPDVQWTIDHMIAEGDTVAARWTGRGTHKGDLRGIAPTGRQVAVTGLAMFRFSRGKVMEAWVSWDALDLMHQLGVGLAFGK